MIPHASADANDNLRDIIIDAHVDITKTFAQLESMLVSSRLKKPGSRLILVDLMIYMLTDEFLGARLESRTGDILCYLSQYAGTDPVNALHRDIAEAAIRGLGYYVFKGGRCKLPEVVLKKVGLEALLAKQIEGVLRANIGSNLESCSYSCQACEVVCSHIRGEDGAGKLSLPACSSLMEALAVYMRCLVTGVGNSELDEAAVQQLHIFFVAAADLVTTVVNMRPDDQGAVRDKCMVTCQVVASTLLSASELPLEVLRALVKALGAILRAYCLPPAAASDVAGGNGVNDMGLNAVVCVLQTCLVRMQQRDEHQRPEDIILEAVGLLMELVEAMGGATLLRIKGGVECVLCVLRNLPNQRQETLVEPITRIAACLAAAWCSDSGSVAGDGSMVPPASLVGLIVALLPVQQPDASRLVLHCIPQLLRDSKLLPHQIDGLCPSVGSVRSGLAEALDWLCAFSTTPSEPGAQDATETADAAAAAAASNASAVELCDLAAHLCFFWLTDAALDKTDTPLLKSLCNFIVTLRHSRVPLCALQALWAATTATNSSHVHNYLLQHCTSIVPALAELASSSTSAASGDEQLQQLFCCLSLLHYLLSTASAHKVVEALQCMPYDMKVRFVQCLLVVLAPSPLTTDYSMSLDLLAVRLLVHLTKTSDDCFGSVLHDSSLYFEDVIEAAMHTLSLFGPNSVAFDADVVASAAVWERLVVMTELVQQLHKLGVPIVGCELMAHVLQLCINSRREERPQAAGQVEQPEQQLMADELVRLRSVVLVDAAHADLRNAALTSALKVLRRSADHGFKGCLGARPAPILLLVAVEGLTLMALASACVPDADALAAAALSKPDGSTVSFAAHFVPTLMSQDATAALAEVLEQWGSAAPGHLWGQQPLQGVADMFRQAGASKFIISAAVSALLRNAPTPSAGNALRTQCALTMLKYILPGKHVKTNGGGTVEAADTAAEGVARVAAAAQVDPRLLQALMMPELVQALWLWVTAPAACVSSATRLNAMQLLLLMAACESEGILAVCDPVDMKGVAVPASVNFFKQLCRLLPVKQRPSDSLLRSPWAKSSKEQLQRLQALACHMLALLALDGDVEWVCSAMHRAGLDHALVALVDESGEVARAARGALINCGLRYLLQAEDVPRKKKGGALDWLMRFMSFMGSNAANADNASPSPTK